MADIAIFVKVVTCGAFFACSACTVADFAAAASAAVAMISAAVAAPLGAVGRINGGDFGGGLWLFQAVCKLAVLNK